MKKANIQIGERLKKARFNNHLSIKKTVELISTEYGTPINERTIRRIENGETDPKLSTLLVLGKAYHASMDYILLGKEQNNDSLSIKESLKRLNRLIYSMVLIPQLDTNPKSNYYGRYYFLSYDDEITQHLKKLDAVCHAYNTENNFLEKVPELTIDILDAYIKKSSAYAKTQFEPSLERITNIQIAAGQDPNVELTKQIAKLLANAAIKENNEKVKKK